MFFLPLVYLLFKCGLPVWSCFIVYAFNGIVCNFFEARALYKRERFDILRYITYVYLHPIAVSIIAAILPFVITITIEESFLRLLLTLIVNSLCTLICVYTLGINQDARKKVNSFILNKIRKNDL